MAKKPKPRHTNRLTVKKLARLTVAGKYVDGGGLALLVSDIGSKSWSFRFERNGRDRAYVLGPLHGAGGGARKQGDESRGLTLDEARAEARKALDLLRQGIDPIDAKRDLKNGNMQLTAEAAKTKTFEQAATEYYDSYSSEWKNASYRKKFLSSLRMYAFPKIGALPVSAIDTPLVLSVIEPIWKIKTHTADRVRGRIENILDWAKARGYRSGDNPARWDQLKFAKLPAKPKSKKYKALSYKELPALVAELSHAEDAHVPPKALQFLILTAARSGEVIGARWPEIELRAVPVETMDDDGTPRTVMGPVWIIPAERMKEKKSHRVPLSDRAVEILKALPRESDSDDGFVFIGRRKNAPLGKNAFYKMLEAMKIEVTTHGFRSSFRDWAGEETNFPAGLAEVALSHAVGGKVQTTYQRGDLLEKRRVMMKAWAKYCLTPERDATVTDIGAARGARKRGG
jgi:integrase